LAILEPTFNAILDRFTVEERLLEIKQQRPGDRSDVDGELSYSTASSYLSVIKQVRFKWGETRISRMKPLGVQEWLKKMDAAPKTKGHVKALMHRLYEKAMLWEIVEWQRNPMQLVEIKGISKRMVGNCSIASNSGVLPYTQRRQAQCVGLLFSHVWFLRLCRCSTSRIQS
jgi:integrase